VAGWRKLGTLSRTLPGCMADGFCAATSCAGSAALLVIIARNGAERLPGLSPFPVPASPLFHRQYASSSYYRYYVGAWDAC
jgi:hypothetical protein